MGATHWCGDRGGLQSFKRLRLFYPPAARLGLGPPCVLPPRRLLTFWGWSQGLVPVLPSAALVQPRHPPPHPGSSAQFQVGVGLPAVDLKSCLKPQSCSATGDNRLLVKKPCFSTSCLETCTGRGFLFQVLKGALNKTDLVTGSLCWCCGGGAEPGSGGLLPGPQRVLGAIWFPYPRSCPVAQADVAAGAGGMLELPLQTPGLLTVLLLPPPRCPAPRTK